MWKPAVRRGVELPEFADERALPATHGGPDFFRRDGMGEMVFDGPAADLGAVEWEGVEAQGFGSGEAVGTGRGAGQTFFEECHDGEWPGGGVIAAGGSRLPGGLGVADAGGIVGGGQRVETTAGKVELGGGLCRAAGSLEHMAEVLLEGRADAVFAASILRFGIYTVGDVKNFLAGKNIPVRL